MMKYNCMKRLGHESDNNDYIVFNRMIIGAVILVTIILGIYSSIIKVEETFVAFFRYF